MEEKRRRLSLQQRLLLQSSNIKATKEFAAFLKEVHGHTPDEYLRVCRINGD